MPSICSDFAARLAADLRARGARLFYGHSDFGSSPGHIEIDTRQLEGLRAFYRRAAAENYRIDLCIHCLAKQPFTDPGDRLKSGLDARTVFVGTILAAQYLKTKEGIGTILNLALLDTEGSKDPAMVGLAVDLVFDVSRFAAEVAPQKIRAFAVVPAVLTPLSGAYSRPNTPQIGLGAANRDQEHRKLLRVIRRLLCDDKWLSCQPSGKAILSA
jgi:NAD(P)-dependent dehydrogenase (short-subunit alcohol dehydrogenase family)